MRSLILALVLLTACSTQRRIDRAEGNYKMYKDLSDVLETQKENFERAGRMDSAAIYERAIFKAILKKGHYLWKCENLEQKTYMNAGEKVYKRFTH